METKETHAAWKARMLDEHSECMISTNYRDGAPVSAMATEPGGVFIEQWPPMPVEAEAA